MGKGQIMSGGTDGQYSVKLLYDRAKALKALDQVNRWITSKEEQIYKLWYNDPDHKLPGLKLALESLKKWKAYYESIPADPTVSAWCADLSEELSGDVGTIEINGEQDQVLIRPGYSDAAAYSNSRDGQLQNMKAMTPEQWFYNAAMAPGWKKWMPTYRVGTITSLNGDVCSVSLDAATTEIVNAGDRSINEHNSHNDIDIEYMECNGAAFEVGDRVVVEYRNRDKWMDETPVVIGFESDPKSCRNLIFISVASDQYVEFYDCNYKDGTVTLIRRVDVRSYLHNKDTDGQIYNVNEGPNVPVEPVNRNIAIIDACLDANMLIISGYVANWRGFVVNKLAPLWPRVNRYFNVAIPIDFYGLDRMDKGLVMSWLTDRPLACQVYSQEGLEISGNDFIYVGYGIYSDLPLYKLETEPLMQAIRPMIGIVGMGVYGDMTFWVYHKMATDGSSLGYYAEITSVVWTGGSVIARLFLGFPQGTEWFYSNVLQVVGHDNKFYVFWSIRSYFGLTIPLSLIVFDTDLNILHESTLDLSGHSATMMSRTKPVRIGANTYMGFRVSTTSPCFFLNADTYTIDRSIDLPFISTAALTYSGWTPINVVPPAFMAINPPRTNYLLESINEYRFTGSGRSHYTELLGTYHQSVKHLGYSSRLELMAKDHATWCTSTGRVQHEGADGRLSTARCVDYGFRALCVGENLAFINTLDFPTRNNQLDEALRLWKESPGHNYNLIAQDSTTMGFYASMYPSSVHELIIGGGLFNPQTHEYTVTPETITLPPEEYGKFVIIVYNIGQP